MRATLKNTLKSPKQTETFAKGLATTNIDLGFFGHNDYADELQVIMCFRLNTSIWNL